MVADIGALQKEVGALEELKSQLFLEYVDLHSVKVQYGISYNPYVVCFSFSMPRHVTDN